MPFELTWLPEVLFRAGLKVSEVPGWADRGRAPMPKVLGVMCHHTANRNPGNMPTLDILRKGRSDLPGPLSQLGLGRDGTYYIIAAGRSNHAGPGSWKGIKHGNSSFIGIEAENAGIASVESWPEVQLDAYRRGCAAMLRHLGADASMCIAHREWAPGRKIDPHSIDMARFREDVHRIMHGTGVVRPLIPQVTQPVGGLPTLRRGARGGEVTKLQTALKIAADGIFGAGTEAVLRKWQAQNGLVPDGIAGPKTWVALGAVKGAAPETTGRRASAPESRG